MLYTHENGQEKYTIDSLEFISNDFVNFSCTYESLSCAITEKYSVQYGRPIFIATIKQHEVYYSSVQATDLELLIELVANMLFYIIESEQNK